jgi:hypothetical protein
MKRFNILLVSFVFLIFQSCKEEIIDIKLIDYQPGDRYVLLEEFTGVRCVTCPQGAAEIANLKTIYGKNLIPIAIHAGFFAFTISNSKYDFKITKGQQLHDWFGPPDGYPSAVINRNVYSGQNGIHLGRNQWASYISQELLKAPKVKIKITNTYNESARRLDINVEIEAQQDINNELRLTVLLKEDNIIDVQYDRDAPGGIVQDYVHKYVLRDILTNFDGNLLKNKMVFQEKINRNFTYILPSDVDNWWKAGDMQVVAFVSEQNSSAPGSVLNAAEESLK